MHSEKISYEDIDTLTEQKNMGKVTWYSYVSTYLSGELNVPAAKHFHSQNVVEKKLHININ